MLNTEFSSEFSRNSRQPQEQMKARSYQTRNASSVNEITVQPLQANPFTINSPEISQTNLHTL